MAMSLVSHIPGLGTDPILFKNCVMSKEVSGMPVTDMGVMAKDASDEFGPVVVVDDKGRLMKNDGDVLLPLSLLLV
jgi:hypothetical protein